MHVQSVFFVFCGVERRVAGTIRDRPQGERRPLSAASGAAASDHAASGRAASVAPRAPAEVPAAGADRAKTALSDCAWAADVWTTPPRIQVRS